MEGSKPWYDSQTIWGSVLAATAAISALSTTLPGAEASHDFARAAVQLLGVAGSLLAIQGRIVARQTIL